MENNPVTVYLGRHYQVVSDEHLYLLRISVGLAGGLTMLAALYLMELYARTTPAYMLLIGTELVLIPVTVSIALILTAGFTGTHAADDDLALLRLTTISSREMADGYIAAAEVRLKWLWAVGVGLVPQGVIVLAFFLGSILIIVDCFGPGGCGPEVAFLYIGQGFIPALIIGGLLYFVGKRLYQMGIYAGVWLGFRWKDRAQIAAGGIVFSALVIAIPLVWWQVMNFFDAGRIHDLLACVALPLIGLLVLLPFKRFMLWFTRNALN
jgi:hypothetical protein